MPLCFPPSCMNEPIVKLVTMLSTVVTCYCKLTLTSVYFSLPWNCTSFQSLLGARPGATRVHRATTKTPSHHTGLNCKAQVKLVFDRRVTTTKCEMSDLVQFSRAGIFHLIQSYNRVGSQICRGW